ncbi:MAG TPA: gamma-glutamyl-gamma-aminobutyrate hydrolase family protein [Streptosporangiaceae bacterium]|nr:gamma-glutamyl-gamma-aminobutyrate hydrolase family protein [Streptosporangiaceae bacterium]
MRVVVVRHHEEDSAGFIGAAFEARGADLAVHMFPGDGPLPAFDDIDHVVVLGATWSVYDSCPARSWIADELAWLRRADEAGVPVLGICFGAQMLTAAFGGDVRAAERKEIGWTVVDSLDHELIPPGPWLEFHGDLCLPPSHARLLAHNEVGPQAFSLGRHLAVQFHPEVDGSQLGLWLDAGGRDEIAREGHDPDHLLARTVSEEPASRDRADRLVASAFLIAQAALAVSPPAVSLLAVTPPAVSPPTVSLPRRIG